MSDAQPTERALDKLSVEQLKEDLWMINWQLYQWPKEKLIHNQKFMLADQNFKCAEDSFNIKCFFTCHIAGFGLERLTGNRPLKVMIINEGQKVGLVQWKLNCWHQKFAKSNEFLPLQSLYTKNHLTKLPNCQLILDFDNITHEQKIGKKEVLNNLEKLFDSQLMADIRFIVQGQNIVAHLAIVAPASPVFEAMFQQHNFLEAETKTVHIEDIEPAIFKELLRYLYTGTVNADVTKEGLFLASDKYQITSLKRQCEEHLMKDLDVENVVRRLVLAHSHSSSDLLEAAMHFIGKNKQVVCHRVEWKELSETYPALFFHVTQRLLIG